MKTFLKIVLWLAIVLAVLLGAAVLFMDHVLPKTFNTAVPKVLGVDASMESAKVRLWRGYVSLRGLHIGNPEGFKTAGIFDLGEATVDLDMASLASDTIVIDCIRVNGAEVTYEQGLLGNNIGALLDNLSQEAEEEKEDEKVEKESGEKPAKKVIIRQLDVEGTRLNVAMTAMMGASVPVPLPPIHMTGIGEETGGASPIEAVQAIIGGIFKAVQAAVAGAGDLIGGAAGAIADGATATVGAVADGTTAAVGAVADTTKATAGAVVDGASAVGGAVAGGVKSTVGAVADGTSATVGAVVGGATAVGGAVADGVKSVGSLLNPFGSSKQEEAASEE